MSKEFLVKPKYLQGESYPGYLLRFAERNHLDGLKRLAAIFGLSSLQLLRLPRAEVVRLLKIEDCVNSPEQDSGFDLLEPPSVLNEQCRGRVCPDCLRESEDASAKEVWDRPFSFFCARHDVLLIDACSECGLAIDYLHRRGINRCMCGVAFSKSESEAPPMWTKVMGHVFERTRASVDTTQRFIDQSAAATVLRLATHSLAPGSAFRPNSRVPPPFLTSTAVQAAQPWFADWPNGFVKQLSRIGWKLDSKRRQQMRGQLSADLFPAIDAALEDAGRTASGLALQSQSSFPALFARAALPVRNPNHADQWSRNTSGVRLRVVAGQPREGSLADHAATLKAGNKANEKVAGPLAEIPFGSLSRLLLCWLATEARRLNSREIPCGTNLRKFLRLVGVSIVGGDNGSLSRLRDQWLSLLSSDVYIETRSPEPDAGWDRVEGSVGIWHVEESDTQPFPAGFVALSSWFYDECANRSIDVDLNVLSMLTNSSVGLDVYLWLKWRGQEGDRSLAVSWADLQTQFSAASAYQQKFREHFRSVIAKVLEACPNLDVEMTRDGMLVALSEEFVERGR